MRRMITAVLTVAFMTLSVASAETNVTMRVFPVKYADVAQVREVLLAFGIPINADRNLKVLAVRASPDVLDTIGEAIKRLDVAPEAIHNVELTIYMMMATVKEGSGTELPKDLDPVIKQMRLLFPYKDYRLADTALIRVRDGNGGSVSGVMPKLPTSIATMTYNLRVGGVTVSADGKEKRVRINNFHLAVVVPLDSTDGRNIRWTEVEMSTDVDVREGQKIVVGKAGADGMDGALVLVLTAKILD